jgi:F-type H+-transporting ATPase subunit b
MEILKNFGLNPVLLAAQIVNFLIIFFILKKFLYKPILEVLKKRQTTIAEGLKQAEDARLKLEKVVVEEKNILKNAQLQAKKIIEDARLESVEVTKQLNQEALKQNEKILSGAKEQIARDYTEAEKQLALSTSKLAVDLLKKALKDIVTAKNQEEIITSALKKIKK